MECTSSDEITTKFSLPDISARFTKRQLLSHVAQLFDPIGLMGPIITYAKIILQTLWSAKLGWDEEVPAEIKRDLVERTCKYWLVVFYKNTSVCSH